MTDTLRVDGQHDPCRIACHPGWMEPGERLRLARESAKLTVEALADRAGLKPSSVRAHENGQNGIRPDKAKTYASVLKINESWLLYGTGKGPGDGHAAIVRASELEAHHIGNTPDLPPEDPQIDYVSVEILPTFAGAGGGGTGDADREVALVSRRLVQDELRAKPTDLLLINIRGNSMEPLFRHGDQLIIDCRDTTPTQEGPFALLWDDGYVVKNVAWAEKRTKLRVSSVNPDFGPEDWEPDEIKIIGRPVWFARRL